MSLVGFKASEIWMSSENYCGASLEIVSRRNSSLEPIVFSFSNSLPYGVEESRELRILIILIFAFSNTIPRAVSTSKILLFQNQYF